MFNLHPLSRIFYQLSSNEQSLLHRPFHQLSNQQKRTVLIEIICAFHHYNQRVISVQPTVKQEHQAINHQELISFRIDKPAFRYPVLTVLVNDAKTIETLAAMLPFSFMRHMVDLLFAEKLMRFLYMVELGKLNKPFVTVNNRMGTTVLIEEMTVKSFRTVWPVELPIQSLRVLERRPQYLCGFRLRYHKVKQGYVFECPVQRQAQLSALFDYGSFTDGKAKSRGYLVHRTLHAIYRTYQKELTAICFYYRYISNRQPLDRFCYFAYQSFLRTVANKHRLTVKQAGLLMKERGFRPFRQRDFQFGQMKHSTGEPYTLKGVRTVLREIEKISHTNAIDPTIHHHLKKISTLLND